MPLNSNQVRAFKHLDDVTFILQQEFSSSAQEIDQQRNEVKDAIAKKYNNDSGAPLHLRQGYDDFRQMISALASSANNTNTSQIVAAELAKLDLVIETVVNNENVPESLPGSQLKRITIWAHAKQGPKFCI